MDGDSNEMPQFKVCYYAHQNRKLKGSAAGPALDPKVPYNVNEKHNKKMMYFTALFFRGELLEIRWILLLYCLHTPTWIIATNIEPYL